MSQPRLEHPKDIAFLKSNNESILITLIFDNGELAGNFYWHLIKDKEIDFKVALNDDDTYTFLLKSDAGPYTFTVDTKHTLENSPTMTMIFQDEHKDYLYLTCGFRQGGQNVQRLPESVPVFVSQV